MNKGIIEKTFLGESDIDKINEFSRRELTADEVYTFSLRLCDNEVDRDFECFSVETLGRLAELFIGKTGLFDHSMKSADQKARIYDAYLEKQEGEYTSYGEALYALKAKAYMLRSDENAELINEIEAGIKKEVSVSCSVEKNICSICGKDRKQERCGHINGNTYGKKLCFGILEGALDAYEFSFVAVPAQKKAGVTKAFKIEEDKNLDEIINTVKSCKGGLELTEKQAKSLSDYISELEDKAALGDEYRSALAKEVVKLFSLRFPELDGETVKGVVGVMTAKELKSFKIGFEKTKAPKPQLAPESNSEVKEDFSQFRI